MDQDEKEREEQRLAEEYYDRKSAQEWQDAENARKDLAELLDDARKRREEDNDLRDVRFPHE